MDWEGVLVLEACLNGARTRTEHPGLPVTAQQLALDVAAVVTAGADAVHLHVKDIDGADTLDGTALVEVLTAVRRRSPDVPLGVTTGAWACPDPARRLAQVRSWGALSVLPDFASVNWHEDGADDIAEVLLDLGVGIEAGVWHAAGARSWGESVHRDRCLRVLVELPDDAGAARVRDQAEELLQLVGAASRPGEGRLPVLLHGEGASTWPALRFAAGWGLASRIGLEDVLVLPDGSPVTGNAALVRAARHLLDAAAPTP